MPCAGQDPSSRCQPCEKAQLCDILHHRLHSYNVPSLQTAPLSPCLAALQYESSVAGFSQLFLSKTSFSTPGREALAGPPGKQRPLRYGNTNGTARPGLCGRGNSPGLSPHSPSHTPCCLSGTHSRAEQHPATPCPCSPHTGVCGGPSAAPSPPPAQGGSEQGQMRVTWGQRLVRHPLPRRGEQPPTPPATPGCQSPPRPASRDPSRQPPCCRCPPAPRSSSLPAACLLPSQCVTARPSPCYGSITAPCARGVPRAAAGQDVPRAACSCLSPPGADAQQPNSPGTAASTQRAVQPPAFPAVPALTGFFLRRLCRRLTTRSV